MSNIQTTRIVVFPVNFEEKTGFDRIRAAVKTECMTRAAVDFLEQEGFLTDPGEIRVRLKRVHEFIRMSSEDEFMLESYTDLRGPLSKLDLEGRYLESSEFADLRKNLHAARAVLNFFKKTDRKEKYPAITSMCAPVKVYPYILERIDKVISRQGRVRDQASGELARIRTDLSDLETRVSKKLQYILKKVQKEGMADADATVTIRNGRPVIPVPAGHKRQISGIIHDESSSGRTVFIEPSEVVGVNNEIRELEYAEQREVIRILILLTGDLKPYAGELRELSDFLASLDLVRAKARFSGTINAVMPEVAGEPVMDWKQAVHPLLFLALQKEKRRVVPLDIRLVPEARILVISGPNAGGKSVCLKTVGLLQYMVQCGFLVPMNEDSRVGIFRQLFIDIGDEQSIENDLSTYSSHLLNMKYFTGHADAQTLLLIDEFGTGTEPSLGGAIAEAILEKLNDVQARAVITTHYGNLKHFAADTPGIENGAMLFDTGKMQPLYKLEIGQPGSSFAFEIARNIGLPSEVIETAAKNAGEGHIQFDRHLREIIRDKKYWEEKRNRIRLAEKKLQEKLDRYIKELELTEKKRRDILAGARSEAEMLIREANRKIENTIREIKENQAEKEKTRKARGALREFREKTGKSSEGKPGDLASRINRLKEEEERVRLTRQRFGQVEPAGKRKKKAMDPIIRTGDYVIMKGQEIPGEVLGRKDSKISVRFGHLTTRVEENKLVKVSEERFRKYEKPASPAGEYADWDLAKRKMNFRPEIDVRGQRAQEALQNVADLVDEAVMVECRELRILHGKGDGILRQAIRQYLQGTGLVRSVEDEHVDLGGAGVSVVLLDI